MDANNTTNHQTTSHAALSARDPRSVIYPIPTYPGFLLIPMPLRLNQGSLPSYGRLAHQSPPAETHYRFRKEPLIPLALDNKLVFQFLAGDRYDATRANGYLYLFAFAPTWPDACCPRRGL